MASPLTTLLNLQLARAVEAAQRAAIGALNDTAFEARRAVQAAMPVALDRPTPATVKSVVYDQAGAEGALRLANPTERRFGLPRLRQINSSPLEARVYLSDYIYDAEHRGLGAQITGASRRAFKSAERRLQQSGLMPTGHFMVPSTGLLAQGSLVDAYGNVRGSFIRGLLSYLQAFSDQGYTANTSRKKRDSIAARGRNERGHATINGVVYFVSMGRGERNGRGQHLPAGIWAKRGTHGARVYPVFLYVPSVGYQQRLRWDDILRNTAERTFPRRYAERLERELSRSL